MQRVLHFLHRGGMGHSTRCMSVCQIVVTRGDGSFSFLHQSRLVNLSRQHRILHLLQRRWIVVCSSSVRMSVLPSHRILHLLKRSGMHTRGGVNGVCGSSVDMSVLPSHCILHLLERSGMRVHTLGGVNSVCGSGSGSGMCMRMLPSHCVLHFLERRWMRIRVRVVAESGRMRGCPLCPQIVQRESKIAAGSGSMRVCPLRPQIVQGERSERVFSRGVVAQAYRVQNFINRCGLQEEKKSNSQVRNIRTKLHFCGEFLLMSLLLNRFQYPTHHLEKQLCG